MRYFIILLGVLLMSCESDSSDSNNVEDVSTDNTVEVVDSILNDESIEILEGFNRFLFVKDSLSSDLENVKTLTDAYSSEKNKFAQHEIDSAYFIILDFLKQISIAPEDDKALYEYDEIRESEISKYYKEFGVNIESAEGEYYCVPDYSYLALVFKGDLNPDLDIYKDFLVVSNRHIFDDGGLKISWMELAIQIIETEDFYYKFL